MIDALRLGYCGEVLHLARAMHEADQLLDVFCDPEEEAITRKWLADEGKEWVRPKEIREADERAEKRLAEAMREAGVPKIRSTADLTLQMYDAQSQAAHHRRRWTPGRGARAAADDDPRVDVALGSPSRDNGVDARGG